jgi:hypothetical protein
MCSVVFCEGSRIISNQALHLTSLLNVERFSVYSVDMFDTRHYSIRCFCDIVIDLCNLDILLRQRSIIFKPNVLFLL